MARRSTHRPRWRDALAWVLSRLYLLALWLALPVMPLLASVVFLRLKYVRHYAVTLRKCATHVRALAEGPANHYFRDIAGLVKDVPASIQGACVQCGNCCMDHRCMFLEQVDVNKYHCGIYGSVWRNLSNCGSFPLNGYDIERYKCPSYFVVEAVPVRFVPKTKIRTD